MRPRAITFDVYGTLTRWDETVASALRELVERHGSADVDLERAANAFEAESRRLQSVGAFRSYSSLLRDSLVPALATAGLDASEEDKDELLNSLARVPAFPEVPDVLRYLARGHRLAPISNTDDDLIAGTLAQFGDVFDTVVTAEQARAYKPNPGLFLSALDRLGIGRDEVLHVAQGTFSDLAPCTALGIRVIWVNRKEATLQDGLKPVAIVTDLTQLPETIASLD